MENSRLELDDSMIEYPGCPGCEDFISKMNEAEDYLTAIFEMAFTNKEIGRADLQFLIEEACAALEIPVDHLLKNKEVIFE